MLIIILILARTENVYAAKVPSLVSWDEYENVNDFLRFNRRHPSLVRWR